jgi:hypothetical protein
VTATDAAEVARLVQLAGRTAFATRTLRACLLPRRLTSA